LAGIDIAAAIIDAIKSAANLAAGVYPFSPATLVTIFVVIGENTLIPDIAQLFLSTCAAKPL
jgi:hypothetical protein